jgi:membrane protease subunit HflK
MISIQHSIRRIRQQLFKPRVYNQSEDNNGQEHRNSKKPGNNQPPDLDELWQDINRRLGKLFGHTNKKKGGSNSQQPPNNAQFGSNKPVSKSWMWIVPIILLLIWLASGFFLVKEGQRGVITQFGRYHSTVNPGFNWRLPYPIQNDEVVDATQIRSVEIGNDRILPATGLKNSAMLTADENIVEVKFGVQYRLKDVRTFLFETVDPEETVIQAAESAVREIVGRLKMDEVLSNQAQVPPLVKELVQEMVDKYNLGIEVAAINLSRDGVRAPDQVKAAFDDVLKAGQEAERSKNEAQAYANKVIPSARGTAARLLQEAEGYAIRVVDHASGDAARFNSILPEYRRAPETIRRRMYFDTMQEVYGNVTKVFIDSKQGQNLLYLPLDQILQIQKQHSRGPDSTSTTSKLINSINNTANNTRARETSRNR